MHHHMNLVHITIHTSVFEEEIAFYETYVGLAIQRDMRSHGKDIVFLGSDPQSVMLEIIHEPDTKQITNENCSVGFKSPDVEVTRNAFLEAGLSPTPLISPNPGVKFFYVNDPAGVRVQFINAFYQE